MKIEIKSDVSHNSFEFFYYVGRKLIGLGQLAPVDEFFFSFFSFQRTVAERKLLSYLIPIMII